MIKLYSIALSPWARKARIALYEKGLPFTKIDIPHDAAGNLIKPAEFLAANPRGRVPTLIDGNVTVYESTVVLEYLEDAYPKPPLYPHDVAGRARCRLLEDIGDQDVGGPVGVIAQQLFMQKDPAQRDMQAVAAAKEELAKVYGRLEAEIGAGPWFCGDQFTVADIAIAIPISAANFFQAGPGDDHKRLAEWLDRVMARPSLQKDLPEVLAAVS
jgi:glutathione S-transferase